MSHLHDDDLTTGVMDWALGERLGGETPPDLREQVRERLAVAPSPASRSPWLLAAAVLFGIGVVGAIAVLARHTPRQPVQDPVQNEKPKPAEVVTLEQIEALPEDTRAVIGTGIEDDEVRALLRLRKLEELELRALIPSPHIPLKLMSPVQTLGDDGLALLSSLKSLRRLRLVNQTSLTKRGFAMLARLPQLGELTVSWSEAGDDAFAVLSDLPKLETLALHSCPNVHEPTIARIAAIDTVRTLDLGSNATFAAGWLKPLGRMSKLVELRLQMVGVTNIDIKVPGVGVSHDSTVTDDLLASFGGMHALRRLDVSWSHATPAGIARLKQQLPDLEVTDDSSR